MKKKKISLVQTDPEQLLIKHGISDPEVRRKMIKDMKKRIRK